MTTRLTPKDLHNPFNHLSIEKILDEFCRALELGGDSPKTFRAGVDIQEGSTVAVPLMSPTDVRPASAVFSGGLWRLAGIAIESKLAGEDVQVMTSHGARIPVRFQTAPPVSANGRYVFLSATSSYGVIIPPSTSGHVRFLVGTLVGADGVTMRPDVLLAPDYISRIP